MRRDHSTPDEGFSEERSQPDSDMTLPADLEPEVKNMLSALLQLTSEQRRGVSFLEL